MKTTIVILLLAVSLRAQTNLVFDVLHTRQGDFTNAVITRTTAAYAVVSHPGGLAKVAMTNLPPELQKQFDYDPAKAAAQMEAEKLRTKKARLARIEQQKKIAALAGPVQQIRVTAILDGYGLCQIQTTNGSMSAFVMGLPASVNNYYATRANLENTINNLADAPIIATGTSKAGVRASMRAAEDAHAEAVRLHNERERRLEKELANLEKKEVEYTTIAAFPTGLKDNGIARWQAVQ